MSKKTLSGQNSGKETTLGLRRSLIENEAQTIVRMGHLAVINIIDAYKETLQENGLVYDGPIYERHFDADGPNYTLHKEFEDFLFFNSNTFIDEQIPLKVKVVILVGEEENEFKRRGSKRNARKPRRKNSGGKRRTGDAGSEVDPGKSEEGDSGGTGVQGSDG